MSKKLCDCGECYACIKRQQTADNWDDNDMLLASGNRQSVNFNRPVSHRPREYEDMTKDYN